MVMYSAYVITGYFGLFLDKDMRKAAIYSLMSLYVAALVYMGNSNKKTQCENKFRTVALVSFLIANSLIIINQFGIIINAVYIVLTFTSITLLSLFIFIFNSDKDGFI